MSDIQRALIDESNSLNAFVRESFVKSSEPESGPKKIVDRASFQSLFDTCVVNLSHRTDRWQDFSDHVVGRGWQDVEKYRFEGIFIEGYGELGVTKSHMLALMTFLCRSQKEFLLFLEDDFRFNCSLEEEFAAYNYFINDRSADVFMLNCSNSVVGPPTDNLTMKYPIHRVLQSSSMAGFLIRRRHGPMLIQGLLDSLEAHESLGGLYLHVKELGQRELFRPILNVICNDRVWGILQAKHSYITTLPSLGETAESFSDIEEKHVNYASVENK